jgi:hypothetical protein
MVRLSNQIFELFFIGVVVFFLFLFSYRLSEAEEGSLYFDDYFSKDVSLVLSNVYSSPGDIKVNYLTGGEEYNFLILKEEDKYIVRVVRSGQSTGQVGGADSYYINNLNFNDVTGFESEIPYFILLSKNQNKIKVDSETFMEFHQRK